jgi:hypothetical protein
MSAPGSRAGIVRLVQVLCKYFDWLGNILQTKQTQFPETECELTIHLLEYLTGNANSARLRDCLQARSHIHALAKDIVLVDNDITDVNANAEYDLLFVRNTAVALAHATLEIACAANCIQDTGKFE